MLCHFLCASRGPQVLPTSFRVKSAGLGTLGLLTPGGDRKPPRLPWALDCVLLLLLGPLSVFPLFLSVLVLQELVPTLDELF